MMKFSDKVEVVTESNKRMGTIIWECDCIGSHRGKKNFGIKFDDGNYFVITAVDETGISEIDNAQIFQNDKFIDMHISAPQNKKTL